MPGSRSRPRRGLPAHPSARVRQVRQPSDSSASFAVAAIEAGVMTPKADLIVVGGGPAGMMAGLLFARAGCDVQVVEKHADFFRDFRGDTVHPSTMEILDQLGMLGRFLGRAHNRVHGAELRM